MNTKPTVAAFFAGAGGLDLGFKESGFNVAWANEYDKAIWDTYKINFRKTTLDKRSITDVSADDVPSVTGFIGGPPCQSWSEAGSGRGINDKRGQLFYEYLRLIKAKKPHFFLAENVSGILFDRHGTAFSDILKRFTEIGYNVSYGLVNANDYGVPQDRLRVIIVGYRVDTGLLFEMPDPTESGRTLKLALEGLSKKPVALEHSDPTTYKPQINNHEYLVGGFSSMYMSRNRVRSWNEPSFTIQAGARHAPLHPSAPKMQKVEKDLFQFDKEKEHLYRRLSVRECARIQTFPDSHKFIYSRVADGYKMIGNAVPVELAKIIGKKIIQDLKPVNLERTATRRQGEIVTFGELRTDKVSA